jgi:hypothetical protein
MNAKASELKEWAKKYDWWWRTSNAEWRFVPEGNTTELCGGSTSKWKDGRESAAWRYELCRRITGARHKPFMDLQGKEQEELESIFVGEEKEIVRPYLPPDCGLVFEPELWFCISDKEWNLWAPDRILKGEFVKLIQNERKERGIRDPKDLDWKRVKSPSWLWPELLDLHDREKQSNRFSESDNKTYERAIKRARNLAGRWDDWVRLSLL